MSNEGEEEIIIIGGGGPRPKVAGEANSTAASRAAHYRDLGDAADPYDRARSLIDEAEALQYPVTFETRKAKG